MMSYDDFLNALGERESGSQGYSAVNSAGYLGKYQMGEGVLTDLGYYTSDGTAANDWQASHWTGKDGIHSKADFLQDHDVQETAVRAEMALKWRALDTVSQYAGQTLDGVKLTVSGLLAGAHLVGQGRRSNISSRAATPFRRTATSCRSSATSSNSPVIRRPSASTTPRMTSSRAAAAMTSCAASAATTASTAEAARIR